MMNRTCSSITPKLKTTQLALAGTIRQRHARPTKRPDDLRKHHVVTFDQSSHVSGRGAELMICGSDRQADFLPRVSCCGWRVGAGVVPFGPAVSS